MQETPLKTLMDFPALVSLDPTVFCFVLSPLCPVSRPGVCAARSDKHSSLPGSVDLVLGSWVCAPQGQSVGLVPQDRSAFVGFTKAKGCF